MLTTYMQLEVTGSPKKGKNIGKKRETFENAPGDGMFCIISNMIPTTFIE